MFHLSYSLLPFRQALWRHARSGGHATLHGARGVGGSDQLHARRFPSNRRVRVRPRPVGAVVALLGPRRQRAGVRAAVRGGAGQPPDTRWDAGERGDEEAAADAVQPVALESADELDLRHDWRVLGSWRGGQVECKLHQGARGPAAQVAPAEHSDSAIDRNEFADHWELRMSGRVGVSVGLRGRWVYVE